MKQKPFILFALLLISILSFGQKSTEQVDVKWGPEEKESKKTRLSDIIGIDETGFYTLRYSFSKSTLAIIEHYNMNMQKTKEFEIPAKQREKKLKLESAFYINETIYLFSSFADKKTKKNKLFVQTIDKETLKPNRDQKVVAEIDFREFSKSNSGNFNFSLSRDSSKLMVYYDMPYVKKDFDKFGFHVFDGNMSEIWNKEVKLPYIESLFDIQDYIVDDIGNVYVLGKIYKDKAKDRRKGKVNYKYSLLSYEKNTEEADEYKIDVDGKFLSEMKITIGFNGNLICAGFYSDNSSYELKGSYFLKIDNKTKQILTRSFKEFDLDFITQNMTERQEKKTKKNKSKGRDVEMYEYDIRDIIIKSDGGAIIIGEQYFVRIVTTYTTNASGGMTPHTTYIYHYNDIIVINIDPDGNIIWNQKIAKRQISTDDGGYYSSYILAVSNNKLQFIFNDNIKNLKYTGHGKIYGFANKRKESIVALVTMDMDGNQTRQALFLNLETEVFTRPKVCKQISEDKVILFGIKRKKHKYALLTFE